MSQILKLRDTIVTRIKTLAAGLDVQPHLGRFDEGELQAFMLKAPGVRVAALGLEKVAPDAAHETVNLVVRFGIYVATTDGAQAGDRSGQALGLTEAIVLLCDRNRWGLGTFVKPGEVASAALIYNQAVRGAGVALWAIDLRQPVQLTSLTPETGQLQALFAGLAPNIGAGHQADYLELAVLSNGEATGE